MNKNLEILNLVNQREKLQEQLNSMTYGSIEVRLNNGNKYIYIHQKENGKVHTKYVDVYSENIENLILNNNIQAKKIKKEIRNLNKKLELYGYSEHSLLQNVLTNIDFARKNMVDTIYKQAILEGVATTYADTEDIINGGKVKGMTSDDIMKVVNLKHAWEFILNENVIASQTNYFLLCQINKMVIEGFYYNAGILRTTPVKIGGTSWSPEYPFESKVIESLNKILNKKITNIQKAIELLLFVTKSQLFIDGNKRTAVIFANHFLISKGLGLIVIPENKVDLYKKLLIDYYESNCSVEISKFLINDCYIKIK